MEYMLRDVVSRRAPQLVSIVDQAHLAPLGHDEKEALIAALTEELLSTGLREDDEPNGRGLLIEELIDCVNRIRRR